MRQPRTKVGRIARNPDAAFLTTGHLCSCRCVGGIEAEYFCACTNAERSEILAEQRDRRAVILDEHHLGSSAAERLNTDCAGPGEDVEEPRALHRRTEHIEERLAHVV